MAFEQLITVIGFGGYLAIGCHKGVFITQILPTWAEQQNTERHVNIT